MSDPGPQQPLQLQMNLQSTEEIGIFADFANVWHTPNTFVLDFLAIKQPPHPVVDASGQPVAGAGGVLEARVAARVKIPSEQVFPLIQALQAQGDAWLGEQGRSEPPANWVGGNPG
jgi:hypothetical protein